MTNIYNTMRITQTAATIAALMDFAAPAGSDKPNEVVLRAAKEKFSGGKIEKALLYNPDAIALWLYQKYTCLFSDVITHSQLALPVLSVMPSVTPVCFASMYTGLNPCDHGIQSYTKPVLQSETIFDTAIAAGKNPIIISTEGDSISKIFLEREMDYIICETPDECNKNALRILDENRHSLIVVYNGNYDGQMHRHAPEGKESIDALRHNANAFMKLTDAARKAWNGHNAMTAFLPDHGCHEIDGGLGSHGLDMEEDMNIIHFYNFI